MDMFHHKKPNQMSYTPIWEILHHGTSLTYTIKLVTESTMKYVFEYLFLPYTLYIYFNNLGSKLDKFDL